MDVTVTHERRMRFRIQARQHAVVSDQPADSRGDDAGMTPPELLLAAIGSCAAYYGTEFLVARHLSEQGPEVRVTAEKLRDPARLGNFVIRVTSPVHLSENQTVALQRAVQHCLIHQTMLSVPEFDVQVVAPRATPDSEPRASLPSTR